MMYWGNDLGPGMWVFMALNYLVVWSLIVTGIWLAFRIARRRPFNGAGVTHPEQVLAERYAKGEIDETEYRSRLDVLRRSSR